MSTGADTARPARAAVPAVAPGDGPADAAALSSELDWLEACLQARLHDHFQRAEGEAPPERPGPPPPALPDGPSPWARLVEDYRMAPDERLLVMLALAPQLRPQALDLLFVRNQNLDRGFTEFGGWRGRAHGGFLPTVETALFLLAGNSLAGRLAARRLLEAAHPLRRDGLLRVEHDSATEPPTSAALLATPELLARATTGERARPDFGPGFPARRITTPLRWDDLVLAPEVLDEVESLTTWILHGAGLMDHWGLARAVKPGWRSLFHGPPGTGKTLTAMLIGQAVGADVYRVDLSMVVSKYIGETEKNLATVFDQASNRHWILFFDEADALFGKRTVTSSSNDRHANQEVAYLLQRVEDHAGTVILASNLKSNIDDAFARRFQSMVFFPMPDADQRLRLWQGMVDPGGGGARLAPDVDLRRIAEAHELSGGAIANAVQFAVITAVRDGRDVLHASDLRRAIARELRKEGRTA